MAEGSCFIFTGPEIGDKAAAIESFRENLKKPRGTNLEVHKFYCVDADFFKITSNMLNASLFSDTRLFLIYNAELIKKKDDITAFLSILKNIPADTHIIFISDDISIDKKLEAAIPKANKKIFWELFENKKQDWIRNFLKKEGFSIGGPAIEFILELIENNTEALRKELGNFKYFFPAGAELTLENIESTLTSSRQETVFSLFSAIASQDAERAIAILHILLDAKEAPIQILAGLSWAYQRLKGYLFLKETSRMNDFELKKIGITSKRAIADYKNASAFYSTVQCATALRTISNMDMQIRHFGTAQERLRLEILTLDLCRPEQLDLLLRQKV